MSQPQPARPLKIAVAASGLAHIKRGVETWAHDLGHALRRAGVDATTFQGSADPNGDSGTVVPCLTRFDPRTARLVKALQGLGGWRIGLGSGYEVEQTTFALNLFRRIRSDFDILHVQDPRVALIFESLYRRGLSRPRLIFAHGTEEDPSELKKFSFLQHLAPNYLEDWRPHQPPRQLAFAIPNVVDTEFFRPGDKAAARAANNLPADALIILSVGALNRTHKRMDYLLEEFAAFRHTAPHAILVIAGAAEGETASVLELASGFPPGQVIVHQNAPRARVLQLMQAADLFTLASRHEMLGTAVLEALACGLPVAANDTPTFRWIVGPAGRLTSITSPGALAAQFAVLADPSLRPTLAEAARRRAEDVFSEQAVVSQMQAMYAQVAATPRL